MFRLCVYYSIIECKNIENDIISNQQGHISLTNLKSLPYKKSSNHILDCKCLFSCYETILLDDDPNSYFFRYHKLDIKNVKTSKMI